MHYYFFDAAGDPGFKLNTGSTPFYVQCLIVTQDKQAISDKLAELRNRFKLPNNFEFKYQRNLGIIIRRQFFIEIANLDFEAYIAVLNKTESEQALTLSKLGGNELTNELLAKLTATASVQISKFYLKIDEAKHLVAVAQKLRVRISNEFRTEGINCSFKVSPSVSHKDDGLQVADMIAGLIMDGYETQNNEIFKVLQAKLAVWEV